MFDVATFVYCWAITYIPKSQNHRLEYVKHTVNNF